MITIIQNSTGKFFVLYEANFVRHPGPDKPFFVVSTDDSDDGTTLAIIPQSADVVILMGEPVDDKVH